MARVNITGLLLNHSYVFTVSLYNGSHHTAAVRSLPARCLSQLELFTREQQRTTRYLNLVSEPGRDNAQPLSPPLPFRSPVPIAPYRVAAPFETAELTACPAAFRSRVQQYRQFHSQQVQRLLAVKDDAAAVHSLIAASDGVRLLVSGVYRWSGVTDRLSAVSGLYLIALLTGRVLLLDSDWPDIQRVLLSPLSLSSELVIPLLRHPLLSNLTQLVPVTDIGPITDGHDSEWPEGIILISSIKGIIIRLLTESVDYSPQLRSLGLTVENAVGCVAHSLFTLRLSVLLHQFAYEFVIRQLITPFTQSVGIQIRSWHDHIYLHNDNSSRNDISTLTAFGTQGFFHCAMDYSDTLRLQHPTHRILWFLVSDDADIRMAAVRRWGSDRVLSLVSAEMLGHSNAVDLDLGYLYLRHALAEQWIFSLCEFAVLSQASGYGRWPALLALRGRPLFMLNNDQENVTVKAAKTCMDLNEHGTSIFNISRQWSLV